MENVKQSGKCYYRLLYFFFDRFTIKYDITDFSVTMDLLKTSFKKPGESCPQ